ncbi:MAG: transposase [Microcoleus sp.]
MSWLNNSDGSKIESPQFLKQSLTVIKKASRQHSKKVKGSANRERARKHLVCKHEDVSNRRSDWFCKWASDLTDRFDVLCFETLNLKGIQCLWGRKISDRRNRRHNGAPRPSRPSPLPRHFRIIWRE